MAQKFYVVWAGRQTGVFSEWATTRELVDKFAGARFKSFPTRAEAERAFQAGMRHEDVFVTHTGQCATTGAQSPLAFETLDKSPAGAALLEEVTLLCGKVRWEYRQMGPKGTALPPITGGWDVNANRKL